MSFKEGTYAEYVSPKEEWLAYCPKSLPLHEAGQVPVVALTAWQVPADGARKFEVTNRRLSMDSQLCCGVLRIVDEQQPMLCLC